MVEKGVKFSKNLSSQQKKRIEDHVNIHLVKNLNKHISKNLPKHLGKHLISRDDFYASQVKQHTTTAIIAAFSFLIS